VSCRGKAIHALGECDFKPRDFAQLVDQERVWVEFLIRLTRQRPSDFRTSAEDDIATVMLRDRARWLRN
jgi:hypothetical protein